MLFRLDVVVVTVTGGTSVSVVASNVLVVGRLLGRLVVSFFWVICLSSVEKYRLGLLPTSNNLWENGFV